MTETKIAAEVFAQQISEMTEAMISHDLDALMGHYADDLVFADGATGDRLTKDGLRDYVDQLWLEQPDFAVKMVAYHALGNELAVILEASASMPAKDSGDSVQVRWMIPLIYTFEPATLKVVREISFTDEEAYQQALVKLGVA